MWGNCFAVFWWQRTLGAFGRCWLRHMPHHFFRCLERFCCGLRWIFLTSTTFFLIKVLHYGPQELGHFVAWLVQHSAVVWWQIFCSIRNNSIVWTAMSVGTRMRDEVWWMLTCFLFLSEWLSDQLKISVGQRALKRLKGHWFSWQPDKRLRLLAYFTGMYCHICAQQTLVT